ncbi:MAG: efflux RND transporter periplasmic adaptor subunit [Armatimonadetes bacterium]|nr:efflux RND transporter periplasmic adaptor subunit [Armatimonadota bacterium]
MLGQKSNLESPPQRFPHAEDRGDPRVTRGSYKTLGIVLLGILLCGVGVWKLTQRPKPAPPDPKARPPAVLTVTTEKVRYQRVEDALKVTGTITAWDPLSIGAEANGLRIEQINVDEGHRVRRGQVLATLNSSVLEAQLEQQHARLSAASANASRVAQPNRPQDIAGLRSALRQAKANLSQEEASGRQARANLDNAEINVKRYAELATQGYATQQETENRHMEAERARALMTMSEQRVSAARFAVEQAKHRLSLAEAGGRSEDVQMAGANTREIEAMIRMLEAQIAQTVVRAPDDGLIVKRDAHLGEITSGGKVLFQMARLNQLELRAQVPQTDLPRVRLGEPVRITVGHKIVLGRVREISPLVDPSTRLASVRIRIPTDAGLLPGMYAEGTLKAGSREVLVVPAQAVLGQSDRHYLYLEENGRARRVDVQTGARAGRLAEVRGGVKPGDTVITSGAAFLGDGDVVDVKDK